MGIDLYFTKESLIKCSHAHCRELIRMAEKKWYERDIATIDIKDGKAKKIIVFVLVLFVIGLFGWTGYNMWRNRAQRVSATFTPVSSKPAKPSQEERLRRDIEQNWQRIELAVEGLIKAGLIMNMEAHYSKIYVEPLHWHQMTFDVKKDFTFLMFKYCAGVQKKYRAVWVDILDGYSGKKLAKYDSWGFKVY